MSGRKEELSRRNFLKAAGTAGVGSLLAAGHLLAEEKAARTLPTTQPAEKKHPMPMRKFGKTGV